MRARDDLHHLSSPRRRGRIAARGRLLVGLILILTASAAGAIAEPVADIAGPDGVGGKRRILTHTLDALRVEERWLPGLGVDWRTGRPDPEALPLKGHCSAFVAAACAAFDVYVLRPPDHSERLLANAQCEWLRTEGSRNGWRRIDDSVAAQKLANRGHLVLACYRNPDREDPGHMAVVRPSAKSLRQIEREGPDIAQAGAHNYRRTSAKNGFRLHEKAWKRSRIVYYAHEIP